MLTQGSNSVQAMLSRGYFPAELPPCFTTLTYAAAVSSAFASGSLPPDFVGGKTAYKLAKYNLARAGGLRRNLSLVNPVAHSRICLTVDKATSDINAVYSSSQFSLSQPQMSGGTNPLRAYEPRLQLLDLPIKRAELRIARRYLVQADIASFYSSIYTHSIPWALHTKAVAKTRKTDPSLVGNELDTNIRNSQDQQTIGIPIGPDYSLIISELILSEIDKSIKERFGGLKGYRYVDDYEFCFEDLTKAEDFLGFLQDSLYGYELDLNVLKTRITELPQPLEKIWASSIREYGFSTEVKRQARDIINFFDMVFGLMASNPDSSVTPFAISRIRSLKVQNSNLQLFNNLLLQAATAEIGSLARALLIFHDQKLAGSVIDITNLGEVINAHIIRHYRFGHDSEITWALWGAMTFKIPIVEEATRLLQEPISVAGGVITLYLASQGLLHACFNNTKFFNLMTKDELRGENWLISYEADVQGWLPTKEVSNHVDGDNNFSFLKNLGVKFFDSADITTPIQTTAAQRYV